MNVRQCVAVNEYGACLQDTLADTPEQAEAKFREQHRATYGDGVTLERLACCVVRLEPAVVLGKPHGCWATKPGLSDGEEPGLTEPCRRAFSREEMIEEAKAYMRETWGPCRESQAGDRWHERFGMLVDFIHTRFPTNTGREAR